MGLMQKLGLGKIIAKREINRMLSRAEEFNGGQFGKHLYEKIKSERNTISFLPAEDLTEIDQRIAKLDSLYNPPTARV